MRDGKKDSQPKGRDTYERKYNRGFRGAELKGETVTQRKEEVQ